MNASYYGHFEVVIILIENKADVNMQTKVFISFIFKFLSINYSN
jgi:hypothetical protein